MRSLERPGAKTPRPYPRTETHHGSLMVNLGSPKGFSLGLWITAKEIDLPVLHTVSKRFEAYAGIVDEVLGDFFFV